MSDGTRQLVRRCSVELAVGQVQALTAGSLTDRPTLVCLHGVLGSASSFAPILPYLAEDRLVLAPEIPGYGDSEMPAEGPSAIVEDCAGAIWQVIDAFTAGPVHLIGYHTGAMVAVAATLQRPHRVVRVINISAPLFTPDELRRQRSDATPGTRDAARCRIALDDTERYTRALATLAQPLLVMNIRDVLFEVTARVDALLRNGVRRDYTDWGDAFLESWPQTVAGEMLLFLDLQPVYSASATS